MVRQRDLKLTLRRDLFPEFHFTRAQLHAPKQASIPLDVISNDDHTMVHVPELDLWGIVELSAEIKKRSGLSKPMGTLPSSMETTLLSE
jgi:hypothetical protein